MKASGAVAVLLAALALCTACVGGLEPEVTDPPLVPVALDPSVGGDPIRRNQTFVLTFNTYVDPAPLTYWNTLSLTSGGVTAFGPTSYRMVDRQIVLRTTRNMEPDFTYQLAVNSEVLQSVTGRPYAGPPVFTYQTGEALEEAPATPEAYPVWADVEPIFATCNRCHADPEWKLDELNVEQMVGRPSRQATNLHIVEAYQPWKSYLMHKILWDYPVREQSPQPPAWAGYQQLSIEQQRLIEAWILGGAQESR